MMKKFVVIVIFLLLLTSFTCVAQNISTNDETKEKNKTTYYEDVPSWQVDDYWTYNIQTFNLQFVQPGIQINLNLGITDFKAKVLSVSASTYDLDLSGDVFGSFSFDTGSGSPLGGNFIFTMMSGMMQVRKSDLSALSGQVEIRSLALLTQNPLGIPLPLPLKITVSIDHSSPRPFIDFPLYDGKVGIISEVAPNIEIKVESIILKILNIFIPDIPGEIIVPIEIVGPTIPYVTNQESISVNAGLFNVYKMELGLGLVGNLYYAPDAGSIVKLDFDIDVPNQYSIVFNAELDDYLYQ